MEKTYNKTSNNLQSSQLDQKELSPSHPTKNKKYFLSWNDIEEDPRTDPKKDLDFDINQSPSKVIELNKSPGKYTISNSKLKDIPRQNKIPQRVQDMLNSQRSAFREKAGKFRMTGENKKLFFELEDDEIVGQNPKKLIIVQHPYDGNLINLVD